MEGKLIISLKILLYFLLFQNVISLFLPLNKANSIFLIYILSFKKISQSFLLFPAISLFILVLGYDFYILHILIYYIFLSICDKAKKWWTLKVIYLGYLSAVYIAFP